MTELELWESMGVALAIGLLIGAERERAKPGGGSPGVRTFALIAVLGALAAQLRPSSRLRWPGAPYSCC